MNSLGNFFCGTCKCIRPGAHPHEEQTSPDKAIKNDTGKPRMDLLPPKALAGIAKIFTFGAEKYADFNYKNGNGLDWHRPYAACLRHLNAWNDGEDLDPESGESHLYHAGCCIMMLIDEIESDKGKDTRFKTKN